MYTKHLIALIPTVLAAESYAGIIQIDGAGSHQLQSHALDGLLDSTSPYLSTEDLSTIHQSLNSWGVSTDGKVTVVPIDTQVGLTLFTLLDEELGGGDSGIDASLGVVSTASSSLNLYINDASEDSWNLVQPPFGSQSLGATFVWGSIGSGDGFAWSNMAYGDALSYNFTSVAGSEGLDAEAFQFVSWETDGWSVLGTDGFKADGSQVFTGTVIPAPPAALLLAALAFNRRRRE
ncbi:MAG: hypothetical protein QGI78_03130 [Phycisphaerales bacterium]|jgi:hypothetical protein|nr:hypothetical protein [Phycisphaerales bacterium]